MHATEDVVRMLDDKAEFSKVAVALGLRVPDWVRVTDPQQILNFGFPAGRSYVLKRIAYNPVGRLDLPRLSRRTPQRNAALARWLPISEDDPWILQEFIAGREYCTHGTAINGRLQVYVCCESSASQLNYAMVDKPEIRAVGRAVRRRHWASPDSSPSISSRRRTGMSTPSNAIPGPTRRSRRSTITGSWRRRISRTGIRSITPLAGARPTYWIYHEMWRLLTQRGRRARLERHPARQRRHLHLVGSLAVLHGSSPADPGTADRQSAPPPRLAEDRLQYRQVGRTGRRLNVFGCRAVTAAPPGRLRGRRLPRRPVAAVRRGVPGRAAPIDEYTSRTSPTSRQTDHGGFPADSACAPSTQAPALTLADAVEPHSGARTSTR